MDIIEAPVGIDLSETAFEIACGRLRASTPKKVMLYCAATSTCRANFIKDMYGCSLILVPDELLKNQFVWGVEYEETFYWSFPSA